jgi:hypothetical protein
MLNICEGIKGARHPQLVFETSECPMCLETVDKLEAQQALRDANETIQRLDGQIRDLEDRLADSSPMGLNRGMEAPTSHPCHTVPISQW